MNLENKVVFITGGSSGIGLALAQLLVEMGNRVVICGRSQARLDAAQAAVPTLHTIRCDITQADEQRAALADIEKHFGRLDLLVNNAGIQHNYRLAEEGEIADRVQAELMLNVGALVTLTHRALPLLQQSSEAAILNIGSGTGLMPKPDGLVYSATKAAAHSFTTGLRWQLQTQQIRVFELFPPVVETAMTAGRKGEMVAPAMVAQAAVAGMQANRAEIYLGKMKALPWLVRFMPSMAAAIMQRA